MADGDSLIVLGEDDVGVLEDALDFVNALPRTDGKAMRGRRTGVVSPIVQLVQITSGTADMTSHRYPGKVIQASSDGTTISLTQLATCEAIDANGGALEAGYYLGILSGTKTDGTPLYEVISGAPDVLADHVTAGDVSLAEQWLGAGLKKFSDGLFATYDYGIWNTPGFATGTYAADFYGDVNIEGTTSRLRWSVGTPSFSGEYAPSSVSGSSSPYHKTLVGNPESFVVVYSLGAAPDGVPNRMSFGFTNSDGNFPGVLAAGAAPGQGFYYQGTPAGHNGLVSYPGFGVVDVAGAVAMGRTLGSLPGAVFKGGLFVDGPVYPGSDGGTFP